MRNLHFWRPRAAAAATQLVLLLTLAATSPAGASGIPRIAFSSTIGGGDLHIFLVNPDGSNVTRVSQGSFGGDGAAISPDGRRIVFESPRQSYGQLYLVDVDGGNEHRVLNFSFYGQSGAWSPDGTRIAFSHSSTNGGSGGSGTTWVVNSDGSGLAQLSPSGVDDWIPDWSPDGALIAFTSYVGGRGEIFVMHADGTERQQLTSSPGTKIGPRWSPDGTKLICTYFPVPGSYSTAYVRLLDVDTGVETSLTDGTSFDSRPVWSPDGAQIAFQSNRSGCFQVYRMNADGSNVQRVTWVASVPGDFVGNWGLVDAGGATAAPDATAPILLQQNRPNPFNPATTIRFGLPEGGPVRLSIFDVNGRLIRSLVDAEMPRGEQQAVWDGRDDRGRSVASGSYLARLEFNGKAESTRMCLVR